jgi:hypothetical protein
MRTSTKLSGIEPFLTMIEGVRTSLKADELIRGAEEPTEANRERRLRRRLAAVTRSGTPSGGLRFGIAGAVLRQYSSGVRC